MLKARCFSINKKFKLAKTIDRRALIGRAIVVDFAANGAASYSASKWGVLGLMKSAAMELGQYNITVNALIPGLVDTALTRYRKRLGESIAETGRPEPEHVTAKEGWEIHAPTAPLKVGWLRPDDISPAAIFLASDAADRVTGRNTR